MIARSDELQKKIKESVFTTTGNKAFLSHIKKIKHTQETAVGQTGLQHNSSSRTQEVPQPGSASHSGGTPRTAAD